MLEYRIVRDPNGEKWLETKHAGKALLTIPQLNKGTAFTYKERISLGLLGKLPSHIETLAKQVARTKHQYDSFNDPLNKHLYLYSLHDTNQTLFYALVSQYLAEMLPMIYTPIVGNAVKQFSAEFRHARGLYLTYNDQDHLEAILKNRSNPDIDLVVVTDGEGVLGIGDQGVGGMDIPIAKLMVYTLCGGINPNRTLPILLDVGTNNQELLDDPLYLGWRHKRISDKEYDQFIQKFISAFKNCFPSALLHWEDLSPRNARRNLSHYQHEVCTFNDDMQGTGAVSLAAIMAASKYNKMKLTEHRIVIFGAGTAGTGIADQLRDALIREGLSEAQAYQHFWLIDVPGLLTDDLKGLRDSQQPYARSASEVVNWVRENGKINLAEVVKQVKPTILIGCSSQTGAFSENIIKQLALDVLHPIILPLSNPNEKAEAQPADLIAWTNNQALIATGSPYPVVEYQGETIQIPQNNNALIFPGIGLGVCAVKARAVSNDMLWVACQALASCSPIMTEEASSALLPMLSKAPEVAKKIALAVATEAVRAGLADLQSNDVEAAIDDIYWRPSYLPYRLLKE